MKFPWIVLIVAALVAGSGVIVADPALARAKAKPRCVERSLQFSWDRFFLAQPQGANGCAPAVYEHGKYTGQDPDRYIRLQLRRDPQTGYSPY